MKCDKPLRCRLCGAYELNRVLRLAQAPRNISRLLRSDELSNDDAIELSVYACSDCGFVQLDQLVAPDFYDDYLMTVSHSEQMRAYQQLQAEDFVQRFQLAGKRVIEIGVGDGNYLQYLRAAGVHAEGIEPSAKFREVAQRHGLHVHAGYVRRGHLVPGAPYEAFVARQVLEHVPDLNDFLQGIRASLAQDAYGLIEVPSLEQAMQGGRFYDFFPDHLNYFSARTLRVALERNGYQVLEQDRGMNGEFNIAWVRVDAGFDFADLQAQVQDVSNALQGYVQRLRAQGKRVAVWGSGGKGLSVMAVADIREICYVVDSDPFKQNMYTPVLHLPVVAPQRLKEDPVDAIIVTALAYRDEILRTLRDDLGFLGEIAILGTHLQTLEEGKGA